MVKISHINEQILNTLPSPCWLLEEHLLRANMELLKSIKEQTGVKILLALKGYSLWKSFDLISSYLDGCCASGINEAMLSSEEFKKQTHTYSPAFKESQIGSIAKISSDMVFNSPAQFKRFSALAKKTNPSISLGLRINPEYSESPVDMYNPCGLYSRLGTTLKNFDESILEELEGLHFHALCEQDSSALEKVLEVFEANFKTYFKHLKWVNFGGGHHITRDGYDVQKLIELLNAFKSRYPNLEVYLELGEAVGWQTGVLVATVLDIVNNGMKSAILDTSNEAHMPDTVIMPYRADVRGSSEANIKKFTYRLTGNTCLAGDIMGDYSFDKELEIGDKIIFEDQIHYTMVKATTFNGIPLPSIAILRENGEVDVVKNFDYDEFKDRLS